MQVKNNIIASSYLMQIKSTPILSQEQEYNLACAWIDYNDQKAAHKLVMSHLRLVLKIASDHQGYGFPVYELFSEGTIGLMHAVRKFDPNKGARLATYAMLWIKASIQEYILRSWSLVKIGSSALHKKLFFNLCRIKNELDIKSNSELSGEQVKLLADKLGVSNNDIIKMNRRLLLSDQSLNVPLITGSNEEKINTISNNFILEDKILNDEELEYRKKIILDILSSLNPREQEIFIARKMLNKALTLDELSKKFSISRERVRQIEIETFKKIYQKIQEFYINIDKLAIK